MLDISWSVDSNLRRGKIGTARLIDSRLVIIIVVEEG
jgi:hypothetical protein